MKLGLALTTLITFIRESPNPINSKITIPPHRVLLGTILLLHYMPSQHQYIDSTLAERVPGVCRTANDRLTPQVGKIGDVVKNIQFFCRFVYLVCLVLLVSLVYMIPVKKVSHFTG